ncbi:hypothetical protein [Streptomyces sp. NPDC046759]|uniref:hypothetical protein n=1 Tax=Streptomyces sp. NPDC046759 TaxID=3155019 RepID=UPI0033EBA435
MTDIPEVVDRVSRLDANGKLMVGALLLVRYCSIHRDPKFSPWFEREQQVLARVVEVAKSLARGDVGHVDLEGLREDLDGALEASVPEGPAFQTEIVDHMVFATEVLDFLQAPDDASALTAALERADELAEAHVGMGEEDHLADSWDEVDLSALEAELRGLDAIASEDSAAVLARSESFARVYARLIEVYYTNEDAGIVD